MSKPNNDEELKKAEEYDPALQDEIEYAQQNHYHEPHPKKLHVSLNRHSRARFLPNMLYAPFLVLMWMVHPVKVLVDRLQGTDASDDENDETDEIQGDADIVVSGK